MVKHTYVILLPPSPTLPPDGPTNQRTHTHTQKGVGGRARGRDHYPLLGRVRAEAVGAARGPGRELLLWLVVCIYTHNNTHVYMCVWVREKESVCVWVCVWLILHWLMVGLACARMYRAIL